MDYFICDKLAMRLLREARITKGATITPTPFTAVPKREAGGGFDLCQLGATGFKCFESLSGGHLTLGQEQPFDNIDLLVSDPSERSHLPLVNSHVRSCEVPRGSYLRIDMPGNRAPGSVYVESPALILVSMSNLLDKKVSAGKMHKVTAFAYLLELAAEMCGTYSRNPLAPRTQECTFKVASLTTADDLRESLSRLPSIRGVKLAGRVARLAFDNSASPLETLHMMGDGMPPRYGGLSMGSPVLNEPLDITDQLKPLLNHDSLRPDISWPDLRIAIEHKGGPWHDAPDIIEDDDKRIQDYVTCGWEVFPARFKDISTQSRFNQFALRVCSAMARAGRPDIGWNVRRHLRDEEFLQRQALMLAALLPPLTRYGDIVD